MLCVSILSGCSSESNEEEPYTTIITDPLEITTVFKTGQTKSYNTVGVEILDGSYKDDGFYSKGISTNFTRDNTNNIVTESVTGLMWQDDTEAATTTKQWVTTANFSIENYANTSGDTATTYCSSINLGGHNDWRLPSVNELLTITNKGFSNPAADPIFLNTAPEVYWTSTNTGTENSAKARRVSFYNGGTLIYNKDLVQNIRCVRGITTLETKQLTRDNTKQIVTDQTTNLTWQDNVTVGSTGQSAAIFYCENLSLAGYDDWRLPNVRELRSINDTNNQNPATFSVFQNTENATHWTSTTFNVNQTLAWTVNFNTMGIGIRDKVSSALAYVRCVRSDF